MLEEQINSLEEISLRRRSLRKTLIVFLRENSNIVKKYSNKNPIYYADFTDSVIVDFCRKVKEELGK